MRGLKSCGQVGEYPLTDVAPFTGAWIEITASFAPAMSSLVAPFTGAWIEIGLYVRVKKEPTRRTLHGCVD